MQGLDAHRTTLKVTVLPSELLPSFSTDGALFMGDSRELNQVLNAGRLSTSCSKDKMESHRPSKPGKKGWSFPQEGGSRWQATNLSKNLLFYNIEALHSKPHHKHWQQSLTDGNG